MESYCELVDKALGHSMSAHRTLRTCLDPGSSEWNETSFKRKIEILKKVAETEDLDFIFMLYKKEYREMNKPHVANRLEDGLSELLKHFLTQTAE